MGLDMYLNKKTYIGGHWEHKGWNGGFHAIDVNGKEMQIDVSEISEIVTQVGYWRKANAIHQWFVKNIQKNEDDCREYYVSLEKLKELYDIVIKIYNNEANPSQILPTREGFFFGSTHYDEWYFEDLKTTKEILEKIFAFEEKHNDWQTSYYYQSSW